MTGSSSNIDFTYKPTNLQQYSRSSEDGSIWAVTQKLEIHYNKGAGAGGEKYNKIANKPRKDLNKNCYF